MRAPTCLSCGPACLRSNLVVVTQSEARLLSIDDTVERGEEIPQACRYANSRARSCIVSQSAADQRPAQIGFNRCGQKGSQIK